MFAIGVDLGGTNLRVAAVDSDGTVLDRVHTSVVPHREVVVREMCSAVRAITLRLKSSGTLVGIGVGVPGIIDLQSGMLYASPNLPGWEHYPVRQEIERQLNTTVILENDANAAALGEKWLGAGRHADDMCMITLGTGVGGGLILGGKIYLAMQGDEPARQVFRKAGWALGVMLAGLINTLNLPVIVIGGGASAGWEAFAPAMMEEVSFRSYVYKTTAAAPGETAGLRNTVILRATLGSDAGLIGAARLPLTQ